jgi:hypothetical protein
MTNDFDTKAWPSLLRKALTDEWNYTVYLTGGKAVFPFSSARFINADWVVFMRSDEVSAHAALTRKRMT